MTLTVGSLFSGIGGIELGFERAGMRTLWQVENNPFSIAVLEKHWPDVERFADVRHVGAANLRPVDLICGGFPCQDLSYAGRGAGIAEGTRSGLWSEFARIVRELRPRYVVVENVPALRSRGLGVVLGDLAACGYDAEWDCIPAGAVGAHHRRDRIWIVGYPGEQGTPGPIPDSERDELRDQWQRIEAPERRNEGPAVAGDDGREGLVADADRERSHGSGARGTGRTESADSSTTLADPDSPRLEGRIIHRQDAREWLAGARSRADTGTWSSEPELGRVAHGVPARVDRLKALGNAVVPQAAELVGQWIVMREQ